MKYSGFIDSILAEAAFAKKTNDASWLIGRLQAETDPIKRKLLSVVCNADFIKGMKREAGWLREQKGKLEDIAADIEDGIEEIEAEEVNDHMQSVNYQLAKAAYDDDEDEEEDSMPLRAIQMRMKTIFTRPSPMDGQERLRRRPIRLTRIWGFRTILPASRNCHGNCRRSLTGTSLRTGSLS